MIDRLIDCFIDYEKALDRVYHEKMINCFNDIGINEKDLKMTVNLYWTQKASIRLEKSLSDDIRIKRAVRQGCVLSPRLVNLYTEAIFRHIEDSGGVTIGGPRIHNLRYADDTVLLADSKENLHNMMDKVNEVGKLYSMKVNAKKTKAMVISRNEKKPTANVKVDGTAVEQVGSFNYPGPTVKADGRCVDEIKNRVGIGHVTFSKMKDVLKSTKIPLNTRKRILQCYVWSTLLYGADTWTITKVMKTRIEAFELWAYRRMLTTSWTEKVTNKEVLSRIKLKKRLFTIIQITKLSLDIVIDTDQRIKLD